MSMENNYNTKAAELVRNALEIDNNLAEAHASQGLIHTFYDWNWESAEKQFQQAIALNPGLLSPLDWFMDWQGKGPGPRLFFVSRS